MKHESDKEGQSGKSHLFDTGGISAVFFPQHYWIWKYWDRKSSGKDEMLDAEVRWIFLFPAILTGGDDGSICCWYLAEFYIFVVKCLMEKY